MTDLPKNPKEAMEIVSRISSWRDFDEQDWQAFAGCESETPKIGELDNLLVILDKNVIAFIDSETLEEMDVKLKMVPTQ